MDDDLFEILDDFADKFLIDLDMIDELMRIAAEAETASYDQ